MGPRKVEPPPSASLAQYLALNTLLSSQRALGHRAGTYISSPANSAQGCATPGARVDFQCAAGASCPAAFVADASKVHPSLVTAPALL
jgi:hypothetical protein